MNNDNATAVLDAPVSTDSPDETSVRVDETTTPPISEFRTFCENNSQYIHEFSLGEIILDPARNGRVRERTTKDQSVKELAEKIKANPRGQLVPGEVILGLDNKLYLNAGTGRYLALSLINETRSKADKLTFKALVLIESPSDSIAGVIDNAMENWGRLDLGVLDKALIVSRLMAPPASLNGKQVAARLGIRQPEVSVLRKIGGFTDKVKQWILDDKISASGAYELSVMEPDKVEEYAEKLISSAGGKRVTKSEAASAVAGKRSAKPKKSGEPGESRKGKKQRTTKQVLTFINDEATDAIDKKYGDKNLSAKLMCFAKYLSGGTDETFLKNLAGL